MSTAQAQSYHSITIGEKNTWDDWRLVPSSRPLVSPPPVSTSYAEIVGGDGLIDLTTSLTSSPIYGNRTGSWEFIVINNGQIPYAVSMADWASRFSNILNYLHGKHFDRIILDDEPDYYYTGRLSVEEWVSAKGNSTIRINYNLDPYKRKVSSPSTKKF